MKASNQIQKGPLSEVFQHLIADIRAISGGDCQQAIADIDQNCNNNQRVRIRYSVRPLIPDNCDVCKLYGGGLKR